VLHIVKKPLPSQGSYKKYKMKKHILLSSLFAIIFHTYAQKPAFTAIVGNKVPLICSSSQNGDSARLPIIFNASISGLDPGAMYKYYVSFIKIGDTSNTNATGAGNPIFFKQNGNWQTTTSPDLSTTGGHDTFSTMGNPVYTAWFGAFSTNDSRFTPGSYVYPMLVVQEIGGSSQIFKKCLRDSIRVVSFSKSSGLNFGTSIYGASFANAKNFVALYDDVSGTSSRPVTITYSENDGFSNSNAPSWYNNNVNGAAGAWGTIIPNSLTNGIKRIESISLQTGIALYANLESDAIWGNDSTINPRKGNTPIYIKSDFAPLQLPVLEFVAAVSNASESVGVHKVLVRRRFGNADSTKVEIASFTGNATSGVDFNLLTTKLTFKPYGTITDTVRISITDDNLTEGAENSNFRLQNAINANINPSAFSHQVNIVDNDAPVLTFSKKGATVSEDNGRLKVKVKINSGNINPTNFRVAVRYRNDSCFIPQDFKLGSSNRDTIVQFPGGKAVDSLEFNISIVNNNTPELVNDTIVLALRNPTAPGTIGKDSLFTLVIIDDDLPPLFTFEKNKETINENSGNVKIKILKTGRNKFPSDVIMSVHTITSTAVAGSDFNFNTQILTFDNTINDTTINISIINDNINERTERVFFVLRNSFNSRIGAPDTFALSILDDDLPVYNISRITTFKLPNNIVDSIGVRCGVRGVVYGSNLATSGAIQFTVIDPTGGIQVSSANNRNYTVSEGDSVLVFGTVAQINGMAKLTLVDSIRKIASGRVLKTPTVINLLNESIESQFVKFNLVKLSNPALWPTAPMAANTQLKLKILTQSDSFDMLIDSETDIDGKAAPAGFFNISAIGGQDDIISPFNENYYLAPRKFTDIQTVNVPVFSFTAKTSIGKENRDSSEGTELQCANLTSSQQIAIVIKGGTAARNVDYQSNISRLFILNQAKPTITIKYKMVDDAIADKDETIIIAIRSNQWGTLIGADSLHTITIIDDETTNIKNIELANKTTVYPNPSKGNAIVRSETNINKIEVFDITGKLINTFLNENTNEVVLKSETFENGTYVLKIYTEQGIVAKNLIIVN